MQLMRPTFSGGHLPFKFSRCRKIRIGRKPQRISSLHFGATQNLGNDGFPIGTLDLILWIEDMARIGSAECAENYIAARLVALADQLRAVRYPADLEHEHRGIGTVEHVDDRGFGFLRSDRDRHYFHARGMWDRRLFDDLILGSVSGIRSGKYTERW